MKINKFILLSLLFLIGAVNSYAQKVSNISSRQEQNTIIVSYDLDTPTPCKISLYVSTDGGNIWQGPLKKIDSNYTESVTKGTHEIIWNVLEEFEELSGDNIVFQVKVDNNVYIDDNNSLNYEIEEKIFKTKIDKLNLAIKQNPKNYEAIKNRGMLYLENIWEENDEGFLDIYNTENAKLAIIDFNKYIQLKPKDFLGYKLRGVCNYFEDNYKGALNDFNISIKLNPLDGDAYYCRAKSKLKLKDYKGTIQDCNLAIKNNVKKNLAVDHLESSDLNYIFITLGLGKYYVEGIIKATDEFNKYIELSKNSYKSYYYVGLKFIELKENEKSLIFYNKAEELNNYSLQVIKSKFGLKFGLKDYIGARDELLKIIKFYPSDFELAYYISYFHEANQDLIFLEIFDKAIEINPTRGYTQRAWMNNYLDNYKGAIDDLTKALFYNPNDHLLYFERGLAKKMHNDYRGAIEDYTKEIELVPNDASAYNRRGNAKEELNDYTGAIVDYTKAIELEPSESMNYTGRANSKIKIKDIKGAFADYTRAIEIDPKDYYIYFQRGGIKFDLKDYRGAILDYSKAILLYPDASYLYNARANAKYNIKDHKGAILDYTKAITLDPKEGEYYFNRGDAKIQIKDKIGGCKDLSKAGELGYNEAYSLINQHCN